MQYSKKGIICNRLPNFEVSSLELLCSELVVAKKKWIIYSIYRPPNANIETFVYSNFNYCPLVLYFSSSKSLQKIERIQERALRFLYNDHKSSYDDLLTRSKSVQCKLLVRESSLSKYSRQLEI